MKKFMYGIAAMSLAVAFTGCDDEGEKPDPGNEGECFLDSECGGYACDIADAEGDDPGVCLTECIQQADCAEGYECDDGGECVPEDGGGEVVEGYTKVLLVSRTANDQEEGRDCKLDNPGPDIDYVRAERGGEVVEPTGVWGQHGSHCSTSGEPTWADPGVVLEQLSIGVPEDGVCDTDNAREKYFFMGTGQAYEMNETIQEDTGVLLVEFNIAFEDGDIIEVGEVGSEPITEDGNAGDATCSNINTPRPNDNFSIYLVSHEIDTVKPGDTLSEPDFILVQQNAIGLVKELVILD